MTETETLYLSTFEPFHLLWGGGGDPVGLARMEGGSRALQGADVGERKGLKSSSPRLQNASVHTSLKVAPISRATTVSRVFFFLALLV